MALRSEPTKMTATRYQVDAECAGHWQLIDTYASMTEADLARVTLETAGVTTRLVLIDDETTPAEGEVRLEVER
jgi:hypothetical protein